jgi:hypothetical protein
VRPGDRGGLRGGAGPVAERRDAHQHGVAHRRGQRHVVVQRQLQPRRAGGEAAALQQRRGELFDEERRAARAVVQHPRQPRARGRARQLGDALSGLGLVERLQLDPRQRAVAPQVMPQPAQRMRTGELVGAVRGDDPVLSKTAETSATRFAGKPPRRACSSTSSPLSASCTQ